MESEPRIVICESPEDAEDASAFFRTIWADGPDVVPMDLILAMLHVGAYCTLAKLGNEVIGASLGFRGFFDGKHVLHSHVTATHKPGTGYALKMHQRDWALAHDINFITWTFDPLVRRNAVLNLVKLGATAVEYAPNFYGTMTDAINAGDESDRVVALWDLNAPAPDHSDDAQRHTAVLNNNGQPEFHGLIDGIENVIHLPEDIEGMRSTQDPRVAEWRLAVRSALYPALNERWRITGMLNREAYVLTPPKESA
jgi:predicted GNAT superfamily acetyltransferase